jgi:hypothetical protein
LNKGEKEAKTSLALVGINSIRDVLKDTSDSLRYNSSSFLCVSSLDGIGLARACLPICKDRRMVTFNHALDQFLHIDGGVELSLLDLSVKDVVELENLLLLFCHLDPILPRKGTLLVDVFPVI